MLSRRAILAAAPLLSLPGVARAQDAFPSRSVSIVVPFPRRRRGAHRHAGVAARAA